MLGDTDLANEEMKHNHENKALNSLTYCLNMAGLYDRALFYCEQWHRLNVVDYGRNHPNTLNSAIS